MTVEVREAVQRSVDGLSAVAAFLEVDGAPTNERFSAFIAKLDPDLSVIGIAYLPVVGIEQVESFVAEATVDRHRPRGRRDSSGR